MPFNNTAKWIWAVNDPFNAGEKFHSGVQTCRFRKKFEAYQGTKMTVHISADSRYTLYINGIRVTAGPAKGDVAHQFYDSIDVTQYLKTGENVIAVSVINYSSIFPTYSGITVPVSIMTATPAFIAECDVTDANGEKRSFFTDASWLVKIDTAISYAQYSEPSTITDPCLTIDMSKYPKGWTTGEDTPLGWENAREIDFGYTPEGIMDSCVPFRLIPRMIPFMREVYENDASFERSEDFSQSEIDTLLLKGGNVTVGERRTVSFVVKCAREQTAYPQISFKDGKNAVITAFYREDDFTPDRPAGRYDKIIADGRVHVFEPENFRTFRYVKIVIETADEPITLTGLRFRFVSYPYNKKAKFASSEKELERLFDISFRTLQLCSHETFEDCPYYEQLQYAGDTNVTSLLAGYMTGDWRLTKQSLWQFYWSQDNEGFPQSRYPTRVPQKIISWALLWVITAYDYYMHTGDKETIMGIASGLKRCLEWFYKYLGNRDLLCNLPYWKVVDWVDGWVGGAPDGAIGGTTALISAQYAVALQKTAELLSYIGDNAKVNEYNAVAAKIVNAINAYCFDDERGYYKNSPDLPAISDSVNAWAILAGCVSGEKAKDIASRMLTDDTIQHATIYGRFYVLRGVAKAGAYEDLSVLLKPWLNLSKLDITAWPESEFFIRSMCHAWGGAPAHELLAEVLGVKPTKPGFTEVTISPNPCGLVFAEGMVPTPYGDISVQWMQDETGLKLHVDAPKDVKVICK